MTSIVPAPASPAPPVVTAAAPAAAAAVAGATPVVTAIAVSEHALAVTPGQVLAARVVAIQAGMVELALAGGLVTAASDLPLEPGQTLRLIVDEAGAERVTLKIAPPQTATTGAGGVATSPAAALADEGIPASAATALLAALSEEGADLPSGAGATALAARAAAAGVSTPSQAAAFVRLLSAGLPTTPAAVAGLAQLIDGAPLGRALTTVLDAAASRVATAGGAPAQTTPQAVAPSPAPAPAGAPAAAGTPPSPGPGQTAVAGGPPAAPALLVADDAALASAPSAAGRAPAGAPPVAGAPVLAGSAPAAPPLAGLVQSLTQLARGIESNAVDGRAQALRQALAELGIGLEARLASGSAPERAPLRSLLLALADHPGTDPSLGRAASGLSDALVAQSLVGPALTSAAQSAANTPGGGQNGDPSAQNGAYLQVPLPGGGTAEVRVSPDAGREGPEGGERPRRLAFLLHLSALGPVMIDASAGAAGVDATIRVGSDEARAFLDTQAPELAEALRRSAPAASVRVERLTTPAPERLLAPPPSSGLDTVA